MPSYAYVTLLLNSGYLPGTLALGKSLKNTGSTVPIVLLYSKNAVKPEIVRLLHDSGLFERFINIDDDLIETRNRYELDNLLHRSELDTTLTKLNCWRMTDYDKLVYLDSDTIVIRNIDDLFTRDVTETQIFAAPDCGWPDCFNSGVFLLKPNLHTFEDISKFAENVDSFDGSDQGLLNEFFHLSGPSQYSWNRIPFTYNCTLSSNYEYAPAMVRFHNDIHVLHFIGSLKPWNDRFTSGKQSSFALDFFSNGDKNTIHDLWWNVFDSLQIAGNKPRDLLVMSGNLQPDRLEIIHRPIIMDIVEEEPQAVVDEDEGPASIDQVLDSTEVKFPMFYYKKSVHHEPLVDQSSKGEAWRMKEPRFHFPESETEIEAPREETPDLAPAENKEEPPKEKEHVRKGSYIEDYVKENPIFPWEKSQTEPKVSRVFYNSPEYSPLTYSISFYRDHKVVKSPAAADIEDEDGGEIPIGKSNNGEHKTTERLIGFDDGDALEHYIEEVEKLPEYEDESSDTLNETLEETEKDVVKHEDSGKGNTEKEDVKKDDDGKEEDDDQTLANSDKYENDVAADPSLAKVENDIEDEDRLTKLKEDNLEAGKLADSAELNEEETTVNEVVDTLASNIDKTLSLK